LGLAGRSEAAAEVVARPGVEDDRPRFRQHALSGSTRQVMSSHPLELVGDAFGRASGSGALLLAFGSDRRAVRRDDDRSDDDFRPESSSSSSSAAAAAASSPPVGSSPGGSPSGFAVSATALASALG